MSTDMVPVTDLNDLDDGGGSTVVSEGGRTIALFYHEKEVYAVDNRCPHMGFPLTRGTVEEGILTCHWHHARFELEEGDTFDPWADDVQTFPTEVRDGTIYLDPDPPSDVPPATRWRNRLADGLHQNLSLVMAKAVVGLDDLGDGEARSASNRSSGEQSDPRDGFYTPIETAVDFGTKYRAAGWGRGLTTLGCTAQLHGQVGARDRRRAMFTGVREVADDAAGEPPRFRQYAFDNDRLPKERLKSWFRDAVEVRDGDGAERCLLTAIEHLPHGDVAEIVFAAATDHLYADAGHTVDFLDRALTTLDHVGWEYADQVLASTVDLLTDASRSEELSAWRRPVDVARLCFDAADALPDLVAAGAGTDWAEPEGFVDDLLVDDAEAVMDALTDAVAAGATQSQLADAVSRAALRRVAYFATNNEFSDWDTVHHTFTYANAVYRATRRTDATELYRGCFDAAMSVYLDRFLNQPRAPFPSPGETDRDPATIREDLLDAFDEQGQTNRAASLVSEHFDADGDPADLKRTLGRGLLREDADFHTLQNVTGAFEVHDRSDDEWGREALLATARYLAAHTPTRRENEGTFSIATRLHRGERLHEAE